VPCGRGSELPGSFVGGLAIFRLRPSPPLAYLSILLRPTPTPRRGAFPRILFLFGGGAGAGTVSLLGRRIGCGSWRLLRGLWCLFGHREFGRRDAKMVMVVPEIAEACCACVFMRA